MSDLCRHSFRDLDAAAIFGLFRLCGDAVFKGMSLISTYFLSPFVEISLRGFVFP